MLASEETTKHMKAALKEAVKAFDKDEVPVGAIVVHNNQVIGKGYNQTETLKDPTAHAEMIAITAAANHIGNWRLNECDIYVTLEPCIMCAGAIMNARIKNLFFAEFDPKFGACGSLYNLPGEINITIELMFFLGFVKMKAGLYSRSSSEIYD